MPDQYTRTSIILHCPVALLIFTAFPLGVFMHDLPLSPDKLRLYSWHKWISVSIFLLAVLRVMWRTIHRPPALIEAMPRWEKLAAQTFGAEFTVVRTQQSSIAFVSKQMGVPAEGNFRKFTAHIAVDPAKPEAGTASIEIDLGSIDTGSADANNEVAGKAWFDIKNHPVASFVSGRINSLGKGRYEVTGNMTIKGRTQTIQAPFTLKPEADALTINGVFPLKRLDYGIGSGIWADTSVVEDEVQIRFHFSVAKK
jgi:polyisoprenoid-binding protein YceI